MANALSRIRPLIEANRINDPHTKRIVQKRLQPLLEQGIDTLVYGCTHYRHLSGVIQSILPSHVICVDPAEYVVSATEQELELMGWKNPQSPLPTRFAVSGCPDQFAQSAKDGLDISPSGTSRLKKPNYECIAPFDHQWLKGDRLPETGVPTSDRARVDPQKRAVFC